MNEEKESSSASIAYKLRYLRDIEAYRRPVWPSGSRYLSLTMQFFSKDEFVAN